LIRFKLRKFSPRFVTYARANPFALERTALVVCGATEAALQESDSRVLPSTLFPDGGVVVETVLVIYVLYAAVILIWSSSIHGDTELHYLVISTALLKEGIFLGANALVIELCPAQPRVRPAASIPGALVVSRAEFGCLARWTPPGATLVFCDFSDGNRLDPRVEQMLLELDIDAVYWTSMQWKYPAKHTTARTDAASAEP
jgi:hypothetical protein